MALHLNATLPGLKTKLLNYANVTILDSTGVTSNLVSCRVHVSAVLAIECADPLLAVQGRLARFARQPVLGGSQYQVDHVQRHCLRGVCWFDRSRHDLRGGWQERQRLAYPWIVRSTQHHHLRAASDVLNSYYRDMNLFPPDIFSLLRALAVDANLPTEQLDGIVALGGYSYIPTASTASGSAPAARKERMRKRSVPWSLKEDEPEQEHATMQHLVEYPGVGIGGVNATNGPSNELILGRKRQLTKRNIYTGFDLPSFVLSAFAGLEVDVDLVTILNIGQYETSLTYSQPSVPAYTDSTLTVRFAA